MWVKTCEGMLLNLDCTYVVGYVKPQDTTVAWDASCNGYQIIGFGDLRQTIVNAIDAGYNILEVGSDGD